MKQDATQAERSSSRDAGYASPPPWEGGGVRAPDAIALEGAAEAAAEDTGAGDEPTIA